MNPYGLDIQMDLIVGDIIVELKSIDTLIPAHRAQLFNYLRLTKKPANLLSRLQGEHYAYFEDTNECVLLDKDMNSISFEDGFGTE